MQARVVRPAQPTVVVFRPIAHDEQGPRGQGADHNVECAPRLLVSPLQILEHQDHGPRGALALHQLEDRLRRSLAPLGRRERAEGAVLGQGAYHGQEGHDRVLQTPIEHQEFSGDLFLRHSCIVTGLDPEVASQDLNAGLVRGGRAVGDGSTLEHETVPQPWRAHELAEEARLADTDLPDQTDDVIFAGPSPVERLAQDPRLDLAPHEAGEAPGRRRLEARVGGPHADHLEDLDRGFQPPDLHRAE